MNGNGLDAFKKRGNSKFKKFEQPGDTVAGVITEISDQKQATKFNPNPQAKRELDFWPSGDPVMEVWITFQTQERDPQDPEDTGLRTDIVTVNQKAGGKLAAIMDACEAVGAPTPLPGGFLAVTFTGFDPQSQNPQNPRKLYAAQYQPPAPGGGAFQQPQTQPAQQAPVQQYNEFNPPPQQAAPVQQFQQPPVQQAPAWTQPQAAPAQAVPPAQQAYQPPVQVNTNTGEIAPQQQAAPVQQFQQPQAQQAPVQQQAPAQQGGGVDAVQIQALIAQGMDDNTINATTGAPHAAIAAIRSIS
ncbi:hypothetical protein QEH68_06590 [Paenarthrobacter sp. OM7]|uniref:hypothetical protein n=1 Tax=Paenarthrobacter sp. OM7 TaxID=3041264 RepID=UPI002468F173|nr:hypothetical protein [Paenarthrobacter sp. OM7]WGM21836.1 hypothetical protein QEH68_06590 [Paenarthrobacter sp. OM7]